MSFAFRFRGVAFAIGLMCLLGLPSGAQATLLVVRSLAALVADADHIVVVTGISETSRWDRHKRIVSDMRLRVGDVVKGKLHAGETIVVTRLGGAVGDLGMTVAGEAQVAPRQRAVLFLDEVGNQGAMRVTDMSLGMFPIVTDQGVLTVLPSGAGLALVVEDDQGALQPSAGPVQDPVALADFLALLRDLAGGR